MSTTTSAGRSVSCGARGHDNPPHAQFCGSCGRPLGPIQRCPTCNTENPSANAYCHGCGAALGHATEPAGDPSSTSVPAVEANDLVKRYGELVAVNHINVTVHQGEVYGILGPNGAGKTTFLRMLFGLIRPNGGTIRVLGRSFADQGVAALEGVAGFIETPRFYPALSGQRNLELLAALDLRPDPSDKIAEVLDVVHLTGREQDKVGNYSYGMRQRLGVAASLLRDPRLLVIDEPTNGLDPAGIRDMRALIKRLADTGLTVLLSSHNMLEVEEICDHVTIMRTGDVVFHGTLDDLREQAPETEFLVRTPEAERAAAIARDLDGVTDLALSPDMVRFVAHDDTVENLTRQWGSAGIGIRSLAPARAPLETLFFRLTGGDAETVEAEA